MVYPATTRSFKCVSISVKVFKWRRRSRLEVPVRRGHFTTRVREIPGCLNGERRCSGFLLLAALSGCSPRCFFHNFERFLPPHCQARGSFVNLQCIWKVVNLWGKWREPLSETSRALRPGLWNVLCWPQKLSGKKASRKQKSPLLWNEPTYLQGLESGSFLILRCFYNTYEPRLDVTVVVQIRELVLASKPYFVLLFYLSLQIISESTTYLSGFEFRS